MKLLISAYACAPNRGSEHGSAWNWVTEANRIGHTLWVMVAPQHRESILAASRLDPALQRITWIFPEIGFWPMQQGKEPRWERSYNFLWQRKAVAIAKSLQADVGFDYVHHLTWGGVRAPTFLGGLGVPLIIGPIGGGEVSPATLRPEMPAKGRLLEALRGISNATVEINPMTRIGLHSAAVIFARTSDTRDMLSPALRGKTMVRMELGVSASQIGAARTRMNVPPRLLFAGRLLYWKGVHVAIEAMQLLAARIPGITLTIVGSGPEEARLKQEVARRDLAASVEFIAWMKQEAFMRLYDTHDMLVFPSFHDSTGWVVLEAFCHGLPVACLDLGGPKDIVTEACGVIAGTRGLSTSQVAAGLADKIQEAVGTQANWARLSAGAIARAGDFLLSDTVTGLYRDADTMTGRKPTRPAPTACGPGRAMTRATSDYPVVIVGAGFYGATMAQQIATRYGLDVLLIDKRAHAGGNSHSRVDEQTGIEYHAYGSHIFHTSSEAVWSFITQFTQFNGYRHRVLTRHLGRIYTMPINLMTINAFFDRAMSPAEARDFLAGEIARDRIAEPANLEEKAISLIGRRLYEAFIKGYTQKQWETDPKLLPADIITRLPVRFDYDDRYFSDRFEGIPLDGYAAIFDRMLDHPKITLRLGCDHADIADEISPNSAIVHTGPIDAYYQYRLGKLGWRTLDLELDRPAVGDFQGTTVMNYADPEARFTRIHEFRHYHPERRHAPDKTLIMREYSRFATPADEPYYPINTAADKAMYDEYKQMAAGEPRTIFGGRLGTYKYLDMHQAIGAALKAVDSELVPLLRRLGHVGDGVAGSVPA